ncbi:MAG: hypothetical protein AABX85_03750 [Nanoarchaeota archaeon]
MNKKISLLLFFILISSLLSVTAKAETIPIADNLEENIDKLNNAADTVSNEDARTAYLKQEWTKIFEKTKTGRFFLGMSKILTSLSPVFKLLIGIEYSLSWLFFLSFGVWIALVVIIYRPVKEAFGSKLAAMGVAIIIPAIAAQFKVISKIVSFFTPLFTKTWIIWVSIIFAILLLYIYNKLSKKLWDTHRKNKKKEDEARREEKANLTEKINDIKIKGAGGKP